MSIQEKVSRLIQLKNILQAEEAQYKAKVGPLKEEEASIRDGILESMRRTGDLTRRMETATITRSIKKSLVIIDRKALVSSLKAQGMSEYVSEDVNELFKETLAKDIAKSGETNLDGTEIRETEYLSVREPSAKSE